jgi:hypothetical protein
LQIWIPDFLTLIIRMTYAIADDRLFTADLADSGHFHILLREIQRRLLK